MLSLLPSFSFPNNRLSFLWSFGISISFFLSCNLPSLHFLLFYLSFRFVLIYLPTPCLPFHSLYFLLYLLASCYSFFSRRLSLLSNYGLSICFLPFPFYRFNFLFPFHSFFPCDLSSLYCLRLYHSFHFSFIHSLPINWFLSLHLLSSPFLLFSFFPFIFTSFSPSFFAFLLTIPSSFGHSTPSPLSLFSFYLYFFLSFILCLSSLPSLIFLSFTSLFSFHLYFFLSFLLPILFLFPYCLFSLLPSFFLRYLSNFSLIFWPLHFLLFSVTFPSFICCYLYYFHIFHPLYLFFPTSSVLFVLSISSVSSLFPHHSVSPLHSFPSLSFTFYCHFFLFLVPLSINSSLGLASSFRLSFLFNYWIRNHMETIKSTHTPKYSNKFGQYLNGWSLGNIKVLNIVPCLVLD